MTHPPRTVGANAYPLKWPDGQPRTEGQRRRRSQFKITFAAARDSLLAELRRLGARYIVISTDVPLRRDGLPYADGDPEDPGVAVYFDLDDRQHVIACDHWSSVRENTVALFKTVEALRGIERWGSTEIMRRAFGGFAALPPAPSDWRTIFGAELRSLDEVKRRFRELAQSAHPDRGGADADMARLNLAMAAAEAELGAGS